MQMLLLEGDDMNQKTGICILLCLVLLLVFGIWYQKRGVENTKNTQEQYASETEHTVLTGTPYKEQPAGCFFTGWKNRIYGNRDSK